MDTNMSRNYFNNGNTHRGKRGNGFYHRIQNTYGFSGVTLLKEWSHSQMSYAKQFNQRIFLLRCRKLEVFPKHLQTQGLQPIAFFCPNMENRLFNIRHNFQKSILNLEIRDLCTSIGRLRNYISHLENKIYNLFPDRVSQDFFQFESIKINRFFHDCKFKCKNKIDRLINSLECNGKTISNSNLNQKWFKNLSGTQIPDNVAKVASLGINFGLTLENREIPTFNIIADIESNINKIPAESQDEARLKIVNCVNNFKKSGRKPKSKLLQPFKEIKETKNFIKNNPDIIFTKADKGNVTVALTRNDYNEKVKNLLHDVSTYEVRTNDTTTKIQNKVNTLVKKWENKKLINNLLAKDLRTSIAVPSRFYGLPKIHKVGHPVRPIVSYVGSPTYNLASYFSNAISKNVTPPQSKVINSFELVQKLRNVTIPQNVVLASLDVVSLFTNVPKEAAVSAVKSRWQEIQPKVKMPWKDFEEGLLLCLNSTDFNFDGITYFQKRGLPMGSPFSPILADIVMDDLEKERLSNLGFELPLYLRYVDDILIAVPNTEIDNILQFFNTNNFNIKFTLEKEIEQTINFLDISITRKQDQKLSLNWYRKPTWSGRYLNFFSHHPLRYKKSVVNNLVDRAILLSDKEFHTDNLNLIKNVLQENCYPLTFVQEIVDLRLQTLERKSLLGNNQVVADRDIQPFISIPYIEGLSEKISRILGNYNINIAFKNHKSLKMIFKPTKDRLKKEQLSNIVYSIPCKDNNCKAVYIGQTKRFLQTRIKEHKNNIREPPTKQNALTKHTIEKDHFFDFDRTKILSKEYNYKKRLLLEMCHIAGTREAVNLRTDIENLSKFYNPIIKK